MNCAKAWLAGFGDEYQSPVDSLAREADGAALGRTPRNPGERELDLLASPADWSPVRFQDERCRIIFDGTLHNRDELCSVFADGPARDATDADVVARAYRHWGEDALCRLRGVFALIIWDFAQDKLLCARDPLGMHPLFYAQWGRTLLLSPSIDTLLAHPGVSGELNRAALVDHLAWRWTRLDETYFTQVNRIPPGHVMRISRTGRRIYRYWDPLPPDSPIQWIPNDEAQERFDGLFAQAVTRCMQKGPAGIFLSGGLDSVAVAIAAADICQRSGRAAPWALMLGFTGADCDERILQRKVATRLGLSQVLVALEEFAGSHGTLATALEMSSTNPAPPVQGFLGPAYARLAFEGKQRGCDVILTGEGGDDWLGVQAIEAADMLRSLNLTGIYRLWRNHARSYPFGNWVHLRGLLWRSGARALLRDAWNSSRLLAPVREWKRRASAAKSLAGQPWMAPDAKLRMEVIGRNAARLGDAKESAHPDGFHRQDVRQRLDDPRMCFRLEEAFLRGRRAGLAVRHPYWDADLIELLVRIRPSVRHGTGLSKALVRDTVVRRMPDMGFDRLPKTSPVNYFRSLIASELSRVGQAMGPTRVLGELGVVAPELVAGFFQDPVAADGLRGWGRAWEILNLEAWARAH